MRALIQRVDQASVAINSTEHARINHGFLVLLGIESGDDFIDVSWLAKKVANLRVFADDNGNMNNTLQDCSGEILLISQFTLHASTKKGNRPSFIKAAKPEVAKPLYDAFISELNRHISSKVKTGLFGADMKISLVNNGPVTIMIDSKNKE
ncbi:MAG: D-aminoacyl-tRNA deacylase [Salibacteraceae bacterium]